MQSQAPICPYCNDDHAINTDCAPKDLKKVLLEKEFNQIVEKLQCDGEIYDKDKTEIEQFKRMIDWL